MTWNEEFELICQAARIRGIDPLFVAAIRKTENGGEGREFGILDGKSHIYAKQLDACCATVRNRLDAYGANPLVRDTACSPSRLRYSDAFVRWFAGIYCPVGAANDPTGLNKNWITNCAHWYGQFISGKGDDE